MSISTLTTASHSATNAMRVIDHFTAGLRSQALLAARSDDIPMMFPLTTIRREIPLGVFSLEQQQEANDFSSSNDDDDDFQQQIATNSNDPTAGRTFNNPFEIDDDNDSDSQVKDDDDDDDITTRTQSP